MGRDCGGEVEGEDDARELVLMVAERGDDRGEKDSEGNDVSAPAPFLAFTILSSIESSFVTHRQSEMSFGACLRFAVLDTLGVEGVLDLPPEPPSQSSLSSNSRTVSSSGAAEAPPSSCDILLKSSDPTELVRGFPCFSLLVGTLGDVV